MRFPRTIRLDESDTRVFERAAAPGEWAVCGAFAFADPEAIAGKQRQAFVSSFLGTTNFGRTTFVEVTEIADDDHAAVIRRLALHFITDHGAPDLGRPCPWRATRPRSPPASANTSSTPCSPSSARLPTTASSNVFAWSGPTARPATHKSGPSTTPAEAPRTGRRPQV